MYYGKGLSSKELYEEIYTTCKWPDTDDACNELLGKQSQQVGPYTKPLPRRHLTNSRTPDICGATVLPSGSSRNDGCGATVLLSVSSHNDGCGATNGVSSRVGRELPLPFMLMCACFGLMTSPLCFDIRSA